MTIYALKLQNVLLSMSHNLKLTNLYLSYDDILLSFSSRKSLHSLAPIEPRYPSVPLWKKKEMLETDLRKKCNLKFKKCG